VDVPGELLAGDLNDQRFALRGHASTLAAQSGIANPNRRIASTTATPISE
jgi:hypothetical protein